MSLTDRIIEKEFSMFTTVNQGHDRADCQDDKETFTIMRKSQFSAYDIFTLESYLQDLLAAEAGHRNLVAEKYAWMMAKTAPADFVKLRDLLPAISDTKQKLVQDILNIYGQWTQEFYRLYPHLSGQGRSFDDDSQSPLGATSSMTYMEGELLTYSEHTLRALYAHQQMLLAQGKNMVLAIMLATVQAYGYVSLADAEQKLSAIHTF